MTNLAAPGRVLLACAAIGALYGAGTSVLNHTGPGLLAAVLGHGAAWAGLGLLVSWGMRRASGNFWWCAGGVAVTFFVAVIAYFFSDVLFDLPGMLQLERDIAEGTLPDLPAETPVRNAAELIASQAGDALYWIVATLVVSIPLAVAGYLMARDDRIGLAARITGPLVLIGAMLLLHPDQGTLISFIVIAAIWLAAVIARATTACSGPRMSRRGE